MSKATYFSNAVNLSTLPTSILVVKSKATVSFLYVANTHTHIRTGMQNDIRKCVCEKVNEKKRPLDSREKSILCICIENELINQNRIEIY